MKVEGIPAKLDVDVKHTHVVALKVEIDEETADRIKDIAVTILFTATAMAISKSLVGTANRLVLSRDSHRLDIIRQAAYDKSYFEQWGKK